MAVLQAKFAGLGPNGLTQASGESGNGFAADDLQCDEPVPGLLTDVFGSGRSGSPGATPYADETERECLCGIRQGRA